MEKESISKNTVYLIFASIVQKILAFFYFAFLARYLTPEGIGKYSFALAFSSLFLIFHDLGFSTVLVREIAKKKELAKDYFENVFTLKLILAGFVFLIIFLAVNFLNYSPFIRNLIYLAAISMIIDSLTSTICSVFRGHENLKYESIGLIINKLIAISLGGLFIFLKTPIWLFFLPLIFSGLVYFLYSLFILKKHFNFSLSLRFKKKIIFSFIPIAFPIALSGAFTSIYASIGQVLLSKLAGDQFVGWFSAALKLPTALLFIPGVLGATTFPAFSHYFVFSKEDLARVFEKTIFYLLMFALPLTFGGIILSREIMNLIYGINFQAASSAFKVLSFGLVFFFLDYPLSSILTAANRQKENSLSRGLATAVYIFLSIFLIPKYFHFGASLAYVAGFLLLFLCQVYFVKKTLIFNKFFLLKKSFAFFLSCLLMSVFLYWLKEKISLIPLIIFGGFIYFLGLLLTKGFSLKDFQEFKNYLFFLKLSKKIKIL